MELLEYLKLISIFFPLYLDIIIFFFHFGGSLSTKAFQIGFVSQSQPIGNYKKHGRHYL